MNSLCKNLATLSEQQLAMLVAVAFEAINDLGARKEICDVLSLEDVELERFAEDVLEPLLDSAHAILDEPIGPAVPTSEQANNTNFVAVEILKGSMNQDQGQQALEALNGIRRDE